MLMKFRDERGIAMFTAIMVSFVVFLLGLAVFQLSLHNSNESAYDRQRTQAIGAAEAGIDDVLYRIAINPPQTLPCAVDENLTTAPVAHYHVAVSYYATYPITGSALACPLSASTNPLGAVLTSTGHAGLSGNPTASRTMQTEVRLAVNYGSLGQAIFSDLGFTTQNNFTVNGYLGNDGNLYTNGNWTCNNSAVFHGSVFAQGAAIMGNSCSVTTDLLANGTISMSQSSNVGHNVVSSTSSISMANSTQIYKDATAATTCSGCSGHVSGTITTNHVSPPPPQLTFPTINYVATDWQGAGFDVTHTYSDCNAARSFINDVGSATKTVVRITPACSLSWGNNTTVNVRADLAIITDGSIATTNRTTFQSADGQPHTIYFIVPASAGASCAGGLHDISLSNNTSFSNIREFAYTPCTANFNNSNNGLGGQIYGKNVSIANQFALAFIPLPIPGLASVTGFNADIAYLREIVNP